MMAQAAATLQSLADQEAGCTRCPLYLNATHVVPGEGSVRAPLMLVGEQPGDQEDLAGKPFVGPAGRVLDRGLDDAGIARAQVFVTNAVKHFKHETRGKRRLHKKPNAYEIERCKWWLDRERELVQPSVIVALGATAARSLVGRPVTIASVRAEPIRLPDATLLVTVHPSALLRIRESKERESKYRQFVADLKRAKSLLSRF